MNIHLGFDPGLTGAMAALHTDGAFLGVWDLPVLYVENSQGDVRRQYDEPAIRALVLQHAPAGFDVHHTGLMAWIERQQPMPGFGKACPRCRQKRSQGAVSTFATGDGYGLLRGVLVGLGVPYERVHPRTWKARMGLSSDKGQSLQKARALFPGADLGRKKDAGRAEALLIAEYGRRLSLGQESML